MGASEHPSERREYKRHELWFPVTLEVDGKQIWSICRDVSRRGLLVSARQPLAVGAHVTARFKVAATDPEEHVVRAKVVRCEDNGTELGLVFPAHLGLQFDDVIESIEPI